jgi:RND superfamily putative drug exporter
VAFSTESLAITSGRHPWATIGLWAVVLAVAGLLISTLLSGVLTTQFDFANEPESKRADRLLSERMAGLSRKPSEIVIVRSETLTVDDPAFRAHVEGLLSELAALGPDVVEGGVTYYMTGAPTMVSRDRHATIIPITLGGTLSDAQANAERIEDAVLREADGTDGFRLYMTGPGAVGRDFQEVAERDLRTGETFGISMAIVILVVVFGAVVAAFVPIVLAVVAIAAALGLTVLVGQLFGLSFFVTNMISMMGLAVGIDYSLFIVSRFREERRLGREKLEAIAKTGATASRAVLFSGITVIIALTGILIVPTTVFRSLAIGAILVVFAAVMASLTLLPAALSLLGDRVNALRVPFAGARETDAGNPYQSGGFWDRVTRLVMGRPVLSLVAATAVLLLAAVNALDIRTGTAGVSTLPDGLPSKEAFVLLQEQFDGGLTSQADVVIDGDIASPDVQNAIQSLTTAAQSMLGTYGPPAQLVVNEAGDLALLSIPVVGDASDEAALAAVRALRSEHIPQAFGGVDAEVLVTGPVAGNIDFFDIADRYTPLVFAFVLSLSFILLTVVFRSIVVPVKAIVMNLLSVGAAYGLVVLVTQEGVGADLLGFQQVDAIEAWLPMFLFAVLFGLSMDYHVFLLSRIRERFDQTGDNTGSVAFGLRSTASIITGAALIMVAVFSGFAAGDLVMFQQLGFGLAVAVFLDATVVRSVLVPAAMQLLGDRNWYFPPFLSWLPRIGIEGQPEDASPLPQPVKSA